MKNHSISSLNLNSDLILIFKYSNLKNGKKPLVGTENANCPQRPGLRLDNARTIRQKRTTTRASGESL